MTTDYTGGYTPTADPTARPDRDEENPYIGGHVRTRPGTQISGSIAGGGRYRGAFQGYRNNALNRILGRAVDDGTVSDLQMALIEVGLLDEDEVTFGYADDSTNDALSTVLGIANQQGLRWQDVLTQALAGGSGPLGNANALTAAQLADNIRPQVVLPNRDELRADIDDVVFARSGIRYDEAVLDRITDEAMDHARDLQLQEFNQRHAGEVEEGRSLESFVEDQVEEANPGAVMAHDVNEKGAAWFEAIRTPV